MASSLEQSSRLLSSGSDADPQHAMQGPAAAASAAATPPLYASEPAAAAEAAMAAAGAGAAETAEAVARPAEGAAGPGAAAGGRTLCPTSLSQQEIGAASFALLEGAICNEDGSSASPLSQQALLLLSRGDAVTSSTSSTAAAAVCGTALPPATDPFDAAAAVVAAACLSKPLTAAAGSAAHTAASAETAVAAAETAARSPSEASASSFCLRSALLADIAQGQSRTPLVPVAHAAGGVYGGEGGASAADISAAVAAILRSRWGSSAAFAPAASGAVHRRAAAARGYRAGSAAAASAAAAAASGAAAAAADTGRRAGGRSAAAAAAAHAASPAASSPTNLWLTLQCGRRGWSYPSPYISHFSLPPPSELLQASPAATTDQPQFFAPAAAAGLGQQFPVTAAPGLPPEQQQHHQAAAAAAILHKQIAERAAGGPFEQVKEAAAPDASVAVIVDAAAPAPALETATEERSSAQRGLASSRDLGYCNSDEAAAAAGTPAAATARAAAGPTAAGTWSVGGDSIFSLLPGGKATTAGDETATRGLCLSVKHAMESNQQALDSSSKSSFAAAQEDREEALQPDASLSRREESAEKTPEGVSYKRLRAAEKEEFATDMLDDKSNSGWDNSNRALNKSSSALDSSSSTLDSALDARNSGPDTNKSGWDNSSNDWDSKSSSWDSSSRRLPLNEQEGRHRISIDIRGSTGFQKRTSGGSGSNSSRQNASSSSSRWWWDNSRWADSSSSTWDNSSRKCRARGDDKEHRNRLSGSANNLAEDSGFKGEKGYRERKTAAEQQQLLQLILEKRQQEQEAARVYRMQQRQSLGWLYDKTQQYHQFVSPAAAKEDRWRCLLRYDLSPQAVWDVHAGSSLSSTSFSAFPSSLHSSSSLFSPSSFAGSAATASHFDAAAAAAVAGATSVSGDAAAHSSAPLLQQQPHLGAAELFSSPQQKSSNEALAASFTADATSFSSFSSPPTSSSTFSPWLGPLAANNTRHGDALAAATHSTSTAAQICDLLRALEPMVAVPPRATQVDMRAAWTLPCQDPLRTATADAAPLIAAAAPPPLTTTGRLRTAASSTADSAGLITAAAGLTTAAAGLTTAAAGLTTATSLRPAAGRLPTAGRLPAAETGRLTAASFERGHTTAGAGITEGPAGACNNRKVRLYLDGLGPRGVNGGRAGGGWRRAGGGGVFAGGVARFFSQKLRCCWDRSKQQQLLLHPLRLATTTATQNEDDGDEAGFYEEENERRPPFGCSFRGRGHFGCVNAISFSTDGELLASGSDDTRVLLWRATGAKKVPVHQIQTLHSANIFCVQFDTSDQYLLTSGNDGRVIRTCIQHPHDVAVRNDLDETMLLRGGAPADLPMRLRLLRLRELGGASYQASFLFSSHTQAIAAMEGGTLETFDFRERHGLGQVVERTLASVLSVAVHPLDDFLYAFCCCPKAALCDIRKNKAVCILKEPLRYCSTWPPPPAGAAAARSSSLPTASGSSWAAALQQQQRCRKRAAVTDTGQQQQQQFASSTMSSTNRRRREWTAALAAASVLPEGAPTAAAPAAAAETTTGQELLSGTAAEREGSRADEATSDAVDGATGDAVDRATGDAVAVRRFLLRRRRRAARAAQRTRSSGIPLALLDAPPSGIDAADIISIRRLAAATAQRISEAQQLSRWTFTVHQPLTLADTQESQQQQHHTEQQVQPQPPQHPPQQQQQQQQPQQQQQLQQDHQAHLEQEQQPQQDHQAQQQQQQPAQQQQQQVEGVREQHETQALQQPRQVDEWRQQIGGEQLLPHRQEQQQEVQSQQLQPEGQEDETTGRQQQRRGEPEQTVTQLAADDAATPWSGHCRRESAAIAESVAAAESASAASAATPDGYREQYRPAAAHVGIAVSSSLGEAAAGSSRGGIAPDRQHALAAEVVMREAASESSRAVSRCKRARHSEEQQQQQGSQERDQLLLREQQHEVEEKQSQARAQQQPRQEVEELLRALRQQGELVQKEDGAREETEAAAAASLRRCRRRVSYSVNDAAATEEEAWRRQSPAAAAEPPSLSAELLADLASAALHVTGDLQQKSRAFLHETSSRGNTDNSSNSNDSSSSSSSSNNSNSSSNISSDVRRSNASSDTTSSRASGGDDSQRRAAEESRQRSIDDEAGAFGSSSSSSICSRGSVESALVSSTVSGSRNSGGEGSGSRSLSSGWRWEEESGVQEEPGEALTTVLQRIMQRHQRGTSNAAAAVARSTAMSGAVSTSAAPLVAVAALHEDRPAVGSLHARGALQPVIMAVPRDSRGDAGAATAEERAASGEEAGAGGYVSDPEEFSAAGSSFFQTEERRTALSAVSLAADIVAADSQRRETPAAAAGERAVAVSDRGEISTPARRGAAAETAAERETGVSGSGGGSSAAGAVAKEEMRGVQEGVAAEIRDDSAAASLEVRPPLASEITQHRIDDTEEAAAAAAAEEREEFSAAATGSDAAAAVQTRESGSDSSRHQSGGSSGSNRPLQLQLRLHAMRTRMEREMASSASASSSSRRRRETAGDIEEDKGVVVRKQREESTPLRGADRVVFSWCGRLMLIIRRRRYPLVYVTGHPLPIFELRSEGWRNFMTLKAGCFLFDDRHIAIGSEDKRVHVWRLPDVIDMEEYVKQRYTQVLHSVFCLRGHSSIVNCCASTPPITRSSGCAPPLLASCGIERMIRFWMLQRPGEGDKDDCLFYPPDNMYVKDESLEDDVVILRFNSAARRLAVENERRLARRRGSGRAVTESSSEEEEVEGSDVEEEDSENYSESEEEEDGEEPDSSDESREDGGSASGEDRNGESGEERTGLNEQWNVQRTARRDGDEGDTHSSGVAQCGEEEVALEGSGEEGRRRQRSRSRSRSHGEIVEGRSGSVRQHDSSSIVGLRRENEVEAESEQRDGQGVQDEEGEKVTSQEGGGERQRRNDEEQSIAEAQAATTGRTLLPKEREDSGTGEEPVQDSGQQRETRDAGAEVHERDDQSMLRGEKREGEAEAQTRLQRRQRRRRTGWDQASETGGTGESSAGLSLSQSQRGSCEELVEGRRQEDEEGGIERPQVQVSLTPHSDVSGRDPVIRGGAETSSTGMCSSRGSNASSSADRDSASSSIRSCSGTLESSNSRTADDSISDATYHSGTLYGSESVRTTSSDCGKTRAGDDFAAETESLGRVRSERYDESMHISNVCGRDRTVGRGDGNTVTDEGTETSRICGVAAASVNERTHVLRGTDGGTATDANDPNEAMSCTIEEADRTERAQARGDEGEAVDPDWSRRSAASFTESAQSVPASGLAQVEMAQKPQTEVSTGRGEGRDAALAAASSARTTAPARREGEASQVHRGRDAEEEEEEGVGAPAAGVSVSSGGSGPEDADEEERMDGRAYTFIRYTVPRREMF